MSLPTAINTVNFSDDYSNSLYAVCTSFPRATFTHTSYPCFVLTQTQNFA